MLPVQDGSHHKQQPPNFARLQRGCKNRSGALLLNGLKLLHCSICVVPWGKHKGKSSLLFSSSPVWRGWVMGQSMAPTAVDEKTFLFSENSLICVKRVGGEQASCSLQRLVLSGCVGGCSEHICSWEACLWPSRGLQLPPAVETRVFSLKIKVKGCFDLQDTFLSLEYRSKTISLMIQRWEVNGLVVEEVTLLSGEQQPGCSCAWWPCCMVTCSPEVLWYLHLPSRTPASRDTKNTKVYHRQLCSLCS